MALEKLKIKPVSASGLQEIEALFNPNSYTISKSVTWSPPAPLNGASAETEQKLNAPTLSFGGGSRQLTLELFFDVTEPIAGQLPVADVRQLTNQIVALTRINRNLNPKRPPECEIFWGDALESSEFPFIGVISNLIQKFTLFKSDGKPVRATLGVTFLEFLDPEKDQRKSDPELTTRVIKRGDTLSSIAAAVYRDATLWRVIAEANNMDDPRRLQIGRVLTVPM